MTADLAWQSELRRIVLWAALGMAVGVLLESMAWGLVAAIAPYAFWHTVQAYRLTKWLSGGRLSEIPEATGLWGAIFEGIYSLKRRNRKRKRRLAAIVSEFQASTAALPDAAVVINRDDEIVWFNHSAGRLLGFGTQRDVGQRIGFLLRSPDFNRYIESGEYDGGVEIAAPNNEHVTLNVRLVPYGNQQRLLIARDVSHLHRLEQTRRDFVANASHELRTPLTVLSGYIDMMEQETGEELAAWRMPVTEMRNQALRMQRIITDLLKLARLESATLDVGLEPIDVAEVIRELEDEARELSQGKHELLFEIEPDIQLTGRRSELYSCLSNLVFNALQYTPSGGRIEVRWWRDERGAHFSVRDTGIGVSTRDLPRLTERFYRVDVARSRETGGTGLGLAIVKHALERHQGELEIESEEGKGSCFTCHFPAERLQEQAA
ncbi:MAG: phosphate regulon sensor histidine kinase PhoR [Abyssibacter sp.]|nr:phosphate regulon sensor histidine kinase PhoR [Abyssibacter sp.]MBB86849.1 phosphate regulon sensor histidine kinase PhoR [Xanthomonadales bacterium]MCK5860301.1 phosphate regulon sensor histidine kinase PhoR [Abyssibacter sp.]